MAEFELYLKLDSSIFSEDQYLEFRDPLKKTYSFYSESDLKYRYLRNKYFTTMQFNDYMKKFFTEKNYMDDIDPEMTKYLPRIQKYLRNNQSRIELRTGP